MRREHPDGSGDRTQSGRGVGVNKAAGPAERIVVGQGYFDGGGTGLPGVVEDKGHRASQNSGEEQNANGRGAPLNSTGVDHPHRNAGQGTEAHLEHPQQLRIIGGGEPLQTQNADGAEQSRDHTEPDSRADSIAGHVGENPQPPSSHAMVISRVRLGNLRESRHCISGTNTKDS